MSDDNVLVEFLDWLFGLFGGGAKQPPPIPQRSATVTPQRSATVTPQRSATVTPQRSATVTPPTGRKPTRKAFLSARSDSGEPPGWLGWIVGWGNLVQSLQMDYVWRKADKERPTHFMPHFGIHAVNGFTECPTVGVQGDYGRVPLLKQPLDPDDPGHECEISFTADLLFTERFVEWPCPAWAYYRLKESSWKSDGYQDVVTQLLRRHVRGAKGALPAQQYRHADHQRIFEAWLAADSRLAAHPGRVEVPAFWNANSARRAQFWQRVERYYLWGQWLVWAGEMARIHVCTPVGSPVIAADLPWWREHCASWGVGCSSVSRKAGRITMREVRWGADDEPLTPDLDAETLVRYLRSLVRHTPPPGSPWACGQQIAPPGHRRVLLDLPVDGGVGDFLPKLTIDNRDWIAACRSRIDGKGASSQFKVWYRILNIGLSAASSLTGGAGSAAMGAVMGGVVETVNALALELVALGPSLDGRELSRSEILGLAGTLGAGVVKVADAGGVDLSFEAAASKAGLSSQYRQMLAIYDRLQAVGSEGWGWPYVNDAFSGLIDLSKGAVFGD